MLADFEREVPSVQTTFNHPTPYSKTPPTGDSEDVDPWDIFLEEEGGLVKVEDPRQYGLPKGFAEDGGDGSDMYRVAAWGQLRCLVGVVLSTLCIGSKAAKTELAAWRDWLNGDSNQEREKEEGGSM